MALPLLIPLAIGVAGSVGKMIGRGKANRTMEGLIKKDPKYEINPLAKERLSLARTLLTARMPGAMQAERNIYRSGANAYLNATKAATDPTQLLATAGNIQGTQNEAFTNLGVMEGQDYQRRYGNYTGAQDTLINEGDKVFDDQIRRYGNEVKLRQAQNENRQNTWGDISNLGFSMLNFGSQGGFDNLFKGRK